MTNRRSPSFVHSRRGISSICAATVLAMVLALLAVVAPAPAGASTVTTGLTTPRAMVIDPGTGRLFVAGDDRVLVLATDGTQIASIPNVPGASGMDATQGFIWVNESTAGAIAKIDPASMTVVHTYIVGAAVGDNLAIVGGVAWIGISNAWFSGILRFDLASSVISTVATQLYSPGARRLGASTSEVLVYERGISSGAMHRMSTAAPYAYSVSGSANGYFGKLAINADATRIWTATGAPYVFQEFDGSTLANTGVTYPGEAYPRDVAWSPGHGGEVAGVAGNSLYLAQQGSATLIAKIPTVGSADAVVSMALSSDGDTGYLLSSSGLQVVDLRPTVSAAAPTTVVQNVPTVVTVTGSALGATSSVSIGGVATTPLTATPGQVTFTMPAGVPLGVQPLVVTGPTGVSSSSITVTANTGASLNGTVRSGATPVPSAVVTLSGGPLAGPLVVTAGAGRDLRLQRAGLRDDLRAHDP